MLCRITQLSEKWFLIKVFTSSLGKGWGYKTVGAITSGQSFWK